MKKCIFLLLLAIGMMAATQTSAQPTGTFINVLNQFMPGTVTGGISPSCWMANAGTLTSTSPTGGAGDYLYQWQDSVSGGSWTNILGQAGLTYNIGGLTTTHSFRLQYTDSCAVRYSNVTTIVVYPIFNAGTVGVTQVICYNTQPATIVNVIPPSGGDGTYTYSWEQSPTGLAGSWIPATGTINQATYQPPVLTTPTYFRRIVTSGSGCGSGPSLP